MDGLGVTTLITSDNITAQPPPHGLLDENNLPFLEMPSLKRLSHHPVCYQLSELSTQILNIIIGRFRDLAQSSGGSDQIPNFLDGQTWAKNLGQYPK